MPRPSGLPEPHGFWLICSVSIGLSDRTEFERTLDPSELVPALVLVESALSTSLIGPLSTAHSLPLEFCIDLF